MNRILSWKIKTGVYAYIYLPNSQTHISNRLTKDSDKWDEIIAVVSVLSEEEYKVKFNEMAKEVFDKYGLSIEYKDEFYECSQGTHGDVNIVVLAGEDGSGSSFNGGTDAGGGSSSGSSSEIYDEFNSYIDSILDNIRQEEEKKNEIFRANIESVVNTTVKEANAEINETIEELTLINERLREDLSGATSAINKASELFNMGEAITPEKIQNVLIDVGHHNEWLTSNSGNVTSLLYDYDSLEEIIGSIGESTDVSKGYFSRMATSLNATEQTVGTLSETMDASIGRIEEYGEWMNLSANTIAEGMRWMDLSAATMGDMVNYVYGDGTNSVSSLIDAKNATILDEAKSYVNDENGKIITSVKSEIDGINGIINNTIARLEEDEGKLSSLGNKMDAVSGSISTWMTIADMFSGTAVDLRDDWDAVSGMVRSVTDMVAKTNEKGEMLGYIETENGEIIDVYKSNSDGKWYVVGQVPLYAIEDSMVDKIIPYYSYNMGSYIRQTAEEAAMGVTNSSGIIASISASISGNSGFVKVVADKMIIDADMIVRAISAKTANIGGIILDYGKIYSLKTNEKGDPLFEFDGTDGSIYANNAVISGTVYANKGEIGGITINTSSLSATNFSVTSGGVVVANDIIIKGGNLIGGDIIDGKLIFNDISGNPQTYFGQSTGEEDPILFTGLNERITLIGFKLRKNQTRVVGGGSETEGGPDIYAYTNDVNEIIGNINSLAEKTIDNVTVFEKTKTNQYKKIVNPFVTYFLKKNMDYGIFIEESGSTIKNYDIYLGSETDFNLINYRNAFINITAQDFSDDSLKIDNANLKFFEDGTIDCREIKSENAYIKGYIDAEGEFKGVLKNAHGDLETIKINNNLSLLNPLNDKNIFNLTKNKIEGCYSIYVDTSDVNFYSQNKSTEEKTYKSSKKILSLENINNKTVEINSFNIKLHRFIPFNRCLNEFGEASVEIEIWKNGTKVKTIKNSLPRGCGKETQDSVITYEGGKFESVNSMAIFVSCKIPTTARYGASYCSAQLAIDSFIVTVKEEATGFFIGRDGFRYISPEGGYGLQVNSSGVMFLSSTTWVTLEQYIKTIAGK